MTRKSPARKHSHKAAMSRVKLAIFLLVVPSLVLVFSLFLLAVINLVFNPTFWMTGDTETPYPTPTVINALNMLFFATGAIGFISLLPSAVAGVVLLVKSKRVK